MADPKIIKEWLNKADEDFHFAAANLKEGSNFYAQICFHFQQAAEKYLKAFIVAYDLEFEKSHNLIYLLKLCKQKESALSNLNDECEFLNTFYIETCYPVHWPTNYTKEKALHSKEAALKIAEKIKERLIKE